MVTTGLKDVLLGEKSQKCRVNTYSPYSSPLTLSREDEVK